KGGGEFARLMRQAAQQFQSQRRWLAALAVCWQCAELDEQPLADELLATTLSGVADDPSRLPVTVAAVEYLCHTQQLHRADQLLQTLLADKGNTGRASLWRLAAFLADTSHQRPRVFSCLERALEIEYRALPDVIDVQAVRQDYGNLLGYYSER